MGRLAFTLVLILFFWGAQGFSANCSDGVFSSLGESPINKFESHSLWCKTGGGAFLSTRSFEKSGISFHMLLDPFSLKYVIKPASCLECENINPQFLFNSKLNSAFKAVNQRKDVLENAGIIHSQSSLPGVFLTVDMCPSHHPDMEKEIFQELKSSQNAVAIAMSGGWLRNHKELFRNLRDRNHPGDLNITWVNHTLNHPFTNHVSDLHNFLLEPGVNIEKEVFGMEELFLSYGVVPSPFFRFPGLVSSRAIMDYLLQHYIIPVGSDAWLAKGERPSQGSIILIHGNENEHVGVTLFQKWMDKFGMDWNLLSLSDLF